MNDWYEAEQRIERAQQLTESERWDEAIVELDAAIAINPFNAMWHAQRGIILEEVGRYEDAVAAYEQARGIDPDDREVEVAYGAALSRINKYSDALVVFEEVARKYPDFEPAYCHRICIYAELGRHEQAEEMFYLAQELDEECPHCFYSMGVSLAARGQTERAIYCWQRTQVLEPGYVGVNTRIAQAYRSQGRIEQAQEFLVKELREDPGNCDLLFQQAELHLEDSKPGLATSKLLQIIELDPDHMEAHFMMGLVALQRGAAAQALEHFEAIRSTAGSDTLLPEFDERYGESLYRLGRFDEARSHLERAARDSRNSINARLLLAHCLLLGGWSDDAAVEYRRVLSTDEDNAFAHHNLGLCLFQQGDFETGLSHCTEATRLNSSYVTAMHKTALALIHLCRWRDAKKWIRQSRKLVPKDEMLRRLGKRLWRYRLQRTFHRVMATLGLQAARPNS